MVSTVGAEPVLPRLGALHLLLDRQAIGPIVLRAAGEVGTDLQHPEIVVKTLHIK